MSIDAGTAVKLAFTQAASRWATGLFAALASFGEVFAGVVAILGAIAWLDGGQKSAPVALGAAFASVLAARILLAFVHGGAIRQSAAWLRGQSTGTTLEEMFTAAPRSLMWFAWTLPIELLAGAWKWLGLGTLLWAYGRALVTGTAGGSAALALSMYLVLSVPLSVGWAALRRATLVGAVRDEVPVRTAAVSAVSALLARPGAFLLLLFIGLAGALGAEVVISVMGSVMSPSDGAAIEPTLAVQLIVGVLVAFPSALFELVTLYGFTALRDEPPPAPPEASAPAVAVAA